MCLAELKALHTLDLSRNRIRDVGCTALSQGLSTLRQFKALILADNGIDDHAPGIISLSSGSSTTHNYRTILYEGAQCKHTTHKQTHTQNVATCRSTVSALGMSC